LWTAWPAPKQRTLSRWSCSSRRLRLALTARAASRHEEPPRVGGCWSPPAGKRAERWPETPLLPGPSPATEGSLCVPHSILEPSPWSGQQRWVIYQFATGWVCHTNLNVSCPEALPSPNSSSIRRFDQRSLKALSILVPPPTGASLVVSLGEGSDGAAGEGSPGDKPASGSLSVCRVCKELFDPAANHDRACRFHPKAYTGDTKVSSPGSECL
jgi:hypothetical protein